MRGHSITPITTAPADNTPANETKNGRDSNPLRERRSRPSLRVDTGFKADNVIAADTTLSRAEEASSSMSATAAAAAEVLEPSPLSSPSASSAVAGDDQYVQSSVQTRKGQIPCQNCDEAASVSRCHDCEESYCNECDRDLHAPPRMKSHTRARIQVPASSVPPSPRRSSRASSRQASTKPTSPKSARTHRERRPSVASHTQRERRPSVARRSSIAARGGRGRRPSMAANGGRGRRPSVYSSTDSAKSVRGSSRESSPTRRATSGGRGRRSSVVSPVTPKKKKMVQKISISRDNSGLSPRSRRGTSPPNMFRVASAPPRNTTKKSKSRRSTAFRRVRSSDVARDRHTASIRNGSDSEGDDASGGSGVASARTTNNGYNSAVRHASIAADAAAAAAAFAATESVRNLETRVDKWMQAVSEQTRRTSTRVERGQRLLADALGKIMSPRSSQAFEQTNAGYPDLASANSGGSNTSKAVTNENANSNANGEADAGSIPQFDTSKSGEISVAMLEALRNMKHELTEARKARSDLLAQLTTAGMDKTQQQQQQQSTNPDIDSSDDSALSDTSSPRRARSPSAAKQSWNDCSHCGSSPIGANTVTSSSQSATISHVLPSPRGFQDLANKQLFDDGAVDWDDMVIQMELDRVQHQRRRVFEDVEAGEAEQEWAHQTTAFGAYCTGCSPRAMDSWNIAEAQSSQYDTSSSAYLDSDAHELMQQRDEQYALLQAAAEALEQQQRQQSRKRSKKRAKKRNGRNKKPAIPTYGRPRRQRQRARARGGSGSGSGSATTGLPVDHLIDALRAQSGMPPTSRSKASRGPRRGRGRTGRNAVYADEDGFPPSLMQRAVPAPPPVPPISNGPLSQFALPQQLPALSPRHYEAAIAAQHQFQTAEAVQSSRARRRARAFFDPVQDVPDVKHLPVSPGHTATANDTGSAPLSMYDPTWSVFTPAQDPHAISARGFIVPRPPTGQPPRTSSGRRNRTSKDRSHANFNGAAAAAGTRNLRRELDNFEPPLSPRTKQRLMTTAKAYMMFDPIETEQHRVY
jgi:hypothetical protein